MKTDLVVVVAVCFCAGVIVSRDAASQMGMDHGHGMMGMSDRHRQVMQDGVDPRYRDKANPLKSSTERIKAGKTLYVQLCASCHGASGRGDGPAGQRLNPPARDLTGMNETRMWSDGFLFWTIAEGGVPVKSAMPPYKASLKDNDIWKIILYLRTL